MHDDGCPVWKGKKCTCPPPPRSVMKAIYARDTAAEVEASRTRPHLAPRPK